MVKEKTPSRFLQVLVSFLAMIIGCVMVVLRYDIIDLMPDFISLSADKIYGVGIVFVLLGMINFTIAVTAKEKNG